MVYFLPDKRNVHNWIKFESQIRELGDMVTSLGKQVLFIINPEGTFVVSQGKVGKVTNSPVEFKRSAKPDNDSVSDRVNCVGDTAKVGFRYLANGDIVGEVVTTGGLFRSANLYPKIMWLDKKNLKFSADVHTHFSENTSIFNQTPGVVNLNFPRTLKPKRKTR